MQRKTYVFTFRAEGTQAPASETGGTQALIRESSELMRAALAGLCAHEVEANGPMAARQLAEAEHLAKCGRRRAAHEKK